MSTLQPGTIVKVYKGGIFFGLRYFSHIADGKPACVLDGQEPDQPNREFYTWDRIEPVAIGTPGATWRVNSEPDPHGNDYNVERSQLTMGNLTDDELANAVFLFGDGSHGVPSIEDVIAGKAHMPIAYLTAAKERIRWLSRALERALAANSNPPQGENT
jgi:hypothetical protein